MNEWDEQERRRREKEQMEASLYCSRSRQHGSELTEEQQEERDFQRRFPQFNKVFPISCLFISKSPTLSVEMCFLEKHFRLPLDCV